MLLGLDLRDRAVVVVGGGLIGLRRARSAADAGARVTVVAPEVVEELRVLALAGTVAVRDRPVAEPDLAGAWLVYACTGDTVADARVARWAEGRRLFCVVASDAGLGTARTPAIVSAAGISVGVLSTGDPDPARAAAVRDGLFEHLLQVGTDLRGSRPHTTDDDVLRPGEVVLLGGGPGDPALMTVRARTLLAQADVVVTDRLGPVSVLSELRDDVMVVPVGKSRGACRVTQEQINALLVDHARAGSRVARLKGGDPLLFGRGGEEAMACRAAGVSVRIVPGISSAIAAAGAAGIPVTHRGTADSVHVVNGHSALSDLDLAALRDPAVTTVVLMGMANLPQLVDQMMQAGVDPSLPAAVVSNATTADQRSVSATLDGIVDRCVAAGVDAPAVVVVGQVTREGFLDPESPSRAVAVSSRRRAS